MITLITNLIAQTDLGTFTPPTDAYSAGSEGASGAGAVENADKLISNLIGFVTILAGLFIMVQFFLAAWVWISSGGDAGKLQKARDRMIQAVIGLVLIVAAYGIIGLIGTLIGIDILDLEGQINSIKI